MVTVSRHKPASSKKPSPPAGDGPGGHPDPDGPAAPPAPANADTGGPELPGVRKQAEFFEEGVAAFHSGNYAAALGLFERAAQGPLTEMAHAAQLRISMCRRRVSRPDVQLRTAEDHYNYAVALINAGNLSQAEKHLILALAQAPQGDHLFYALSLCRGLSGDTQGAYSYLKRAIELNPRNRVAARNDPDFSALARLSPVAELLYPERMASA